MSQYIGMNYIGGFLPSRADFGSFNPANEEPIGYFPQSTDAEIDEALEAAQKAFPSWKALSQVQRAEYFWRLAKLLETKVDYVANAISLETGKSLNESKAEVIEALHMAQFCFGKGREPSGDIVSSERDSYVIRKPKGVVGVIAPWNFPFAIGGFWCAGPSLLEGNTVVFKPSELTPMVGQITAELFQDAGFPPGVFNLLHGDGDVGAKIVNDERVAHIAFTGSAEVGRYIRIAGMVEPQFVYESVYDIKKLMAKNERSKWWSENVFTVNNLIVFIISSIALGVAGNYVYDYWVK